MVFVVNIALMQDIDLTAVAGCSEDLLTIARNLDEPLFHCCNMVDEKLPDGTLTIFSRLSISRKRRYYG